MLCMTSKIKTSAEEAHGHKNLIKQYFPYYVIKRTDLRMIVVENARKSKINSPYYLDVG
jgi:hypothetical protein